MEKLTNHYQILTECQHLETLERLIIRDSRLKVDWAPILKLNSCNFPKLKLLELPTDAIFDYNVNDEPILPTFPNLHLKYKDCVNSFANYSTWQKQRFCSRNYSEPMEINKRLSAIGCNKLEISWQPYDNYYDSNLSSLTGINQFTVIEGELIDFLRNLQRINFKSNFIATLIM